MQNLTIKVSGQAMGVIEGSEIYYSPDRYDGGTQGAHDAYLALRAAKVQRAGRGRSYTITTTRAGAAVLLDYCATVGETFAQGDVDADTRAEGRALLLVAGRIRAALVGAGGAVTR
jgi:hypothetical protein